jgi:hypothetical protein
MKNAYGVTALFTALLLFLTVSGRAQVFTPVQCASTLDPEKCCNQPTDEASRVETARSLLKVNARPGDVNNYHTVINFWAVHGSGEDGAGDDGPVYKESIASNSGRQEMWDYLEEVFSWSSDMELVILDEIYQTDPDDSFMYTAVNKWFGTTGAGYYEQPGISIIKFRPGEGCASYQRDYFSEGDTYWGISYLRPFVRKIREDAIKGLGLTDKCVDDDGDGYTKYRAASGCINGAALDCDDYHAEINPGAEEIPGNGVDDDCNRWTRD